MYMELWLLLLALLMFEAVNAGRATCGTVTGVIVRWATGPWFMIVGREPISAEEYRAFNPVIRTVAATLSSLYLALILVSMIAAIWRHTE